MNKIDCLWGLGLISWCPIRHGLDVAQIDSMKTSEIRSLALSNPRQIDVT